MAISAYMIFFIIIDCIILVRSVFAGILDVSREDKTMASKYSARLHGDVFVRVYRLRR